MPSEPRTAFLHIGLPKTGTTAVQAALSEAREALGAGGYHYLSGDRNHGERLCLAFWDKADALRLAGLRWKDGEAAEAHRAEVQAALAREIDEAKPRHLILSAEDVSTFRPEEVERLRRFLEPRVDRIRVIAYLRDPLDWVTSAAQQTVKWSGDLLDDLFDRPRFPEFQRRLTPWMNGFGADAVDLRVYGGGDVVADFSQVVGLDAPPAPGPRLNEAVSHRTAMLLSRANALRPPFVEARHHPLRSFDLVKEARLPGRRFTLPRETVERHAETLAAERDWANDVLGRGAFEAPCLPGTPRNDWFGEERAQLEVFAGAFLEKARLAQNERALRMYLTALKARGEGHRAVRLLDQAWLLATDRWTMDQISREALAQDRSDREKFFAKGRLMRRIEAPEPGDTPLIVGNPYDRPWSEQQPGLAQQAPAVKAPSGLNDSLLAAHPQEPPVGLEEQSSPR